MSLKSAHQLKNTRISKPRAVAIAAALTCQIFGMPEVSAQTIISENSSASSKLAANGATIFDISNPNTGGLSYNSVTRLDVNSAGAVINNAMQQTATQVAGNVAANSNLQANASAILLDATASSRRSNIAGMVELAGPSAKFIMANPYGIVCTGCSFLNFGNTVSLVAGTSKIDSTGNISFVNVRDSISVKGSGLSASEGTDVELSAADVSISAPVNVHNQFVIHARTVDANGVVTTAPAKVVLSGSAMHAGRISINAPSLKSSVEVDQVLAAENGIGITSGGKVDIDKSVSSMQGDVSIAGTKVRVNKVPIESGGDVNLSGEDISFNQSHIAAGQDINVNATGDIYSYAGAGKGSTTVSTPVSKSVTETYDTNFVLNVGERFNIDDKGVAAAASTIKAGATLSDALNTLSSAPGLSGTSVGFNWIRSEVTSLSSKTSNNVSSTTFVAGRDVHRTAGGTLYDQATIVKAAHEINQSATTIVADAYSTGFRSGASSTNSSKSLRGGLFFQGWLPGVYLQYDDSVTNTQSSGNGSEQIGVSYTAGGNLNSVSSEDSRYKANLLNSAGDSVFSARNLTFSPLLSTESQSQSTTGRDVTLFGSLGFLGANAAAAITGKVGSVNGSMSSGKAGVVMAGGNFDAVATQNLQFDGTQITVGGNTTLTAGKNLYFNAIDNSMMLNSQAATLGAFGGASIGWGGLDFEVGMRSSLAYANRSQTSQAAGFVKSRGDISINSGADTTLVGTTLESTDGSVSIAAAGAYKHLARTAHTRTSTGGASGAGSVSFGIGWTGVPRFGFSVMGSANAGSTDVTAQSAGAVSAAKDISISSGGDATLQGASLSAGNKLSLHAGKRLNYDAANSVGSGANGAVSGRLAVNVGTDSLGINLGFKGSVAGVKATSQQRGVVTAKNVDIVSGGDAQFVGTDIRATDTANLTVGGALSMQSARVTYLGGSASAGLNLGVGIGLGAKSSMTPSFGFSLASSAKSLNTNYNAVLAGPRLNLKVGRGVDLAGAVIESPSMTKSIGGPVHVQTRTDSAVGGGFNFNFNLGSTASPSTPASSIVGGVSLATASVPSVSLPWQYTDPQDVNWTQLGGNVTVTNSGNSIGFGANVITAPVTQKKSGIFDYYVL